MKALIDYLINCKSYSLKYITKSYLTQDVQNVLDKYNLTLYELCYRIQHNIPLNKVFICKHCGKPVGLNATHGYKTFCNNKCHSKYIANSDIIKKKKAQTCIARYGVSNPMQDSSIQQYSYTNKLKKNNYDLSSIYKKVRKTNLEKYGVSSYSKTQEFKEKLKQTCLERFGETTNLKTEETKDKIKQTCIKKYGVENPAQSDVVQMKMYKSRKKNGSFTYSKQELDCINLLKEYFKEVKDHYKSNKYPFECDAYIPEIDTYIEFNFYWTHGKEPFDKNNKKHQLILQKWEKKSKEVNFNNKIKAQYIHAIYNWTDLDVRKLETFKKNKLNYKMFYSIKEFKNWLLTVK